MFHFSKLDIHLNDKYVKISWPPCIIKRHPVKAYGGEDVELHASITSTVSRPGHFSPRKKKARYPRADLDALEENCLSLPGIEGRFLNPVCNLLCRLRNNFFFAQQPSVGHSISFMRFLDHTQRRTTIGRTPLDEWSARRRDLYLATHNTHNKTSKPPGGIRTHNLSRRAAVDLRLRPRGHLDRWGIT